MRQVSSGYVNFVASGFHLTPCRLQHSSTLSCRPVSTTATRFSPGRRRLLQLLQQVLNDAARVVSDTRKFDRGLSRIMHTELHWLDVPERINYKLGMLMYRCQHITKLLGTWWTTAHQYPTLPIVNGYALRVVIKSLFHGTGSVPMDVGYLPLLARLSGALCPRTCGIRMFLRTVTGSHWRRFYVRSTSVFSALEFFTRMCYINLHLTFDIDIHST